MTNRSADDINAIRAQLSELTAAPWLGDSRRWWPNYIFHFTDIRNVVSILREGELLSRHRALETNSLLVDRP